MATTVEQRYLEALRRLRVQANHLEEMAKWREDLASRLWRAMVVMRAMGDKEGDIAALELEVKKFCAVADAFAKAREQDK